MAINNSGVFTKSEFKSRGVIKLAPDVLVYISGNQTMRVLAPVSSNDSKYKISFSDGITSVSVNNNVDPPGSSTATIEVVTPIYGETSKYWVSYPSPNSSSSTVRHSIFLPMMEVKIFMKGRYLVDGTPKYYPVFWGLINSVDESYNGGVYKISLQCGDILSWLDKSTLNVHPVPESSIAAGGQMLTVYATIFQTKNPYTIVYDMIHKFFDIDKVGDTSNFVTPSWVAQRTNYTYNYPRADWAAAMAGLSNYWHQRFNGIGTNLKMYGMTGVALTDRGNIIPKQVPPNSSGKDTPEDSSSGPEKVFDIDKALQAYIPLADYEKMGSFDSAEYQTKLQILTEVKNRIHFELFQDVNGGFIFKPPFYNMDVSGVFPYTIYPNEILSCSFQTNSEGIVTTVQTKTAMHGMLKETAMARGIGFHMDLDLAAKYGIRFQEVDVAYTSDAAIARSLAVGELSQINAKCYTGSVTIPGRPEMKLGYPIYLIHRDSYHYVKAINHQFDYGGTCSTTLSLEAERQYRVGVDIGRGPTLTYGQVVPTGPNKSFIFDPIKKITEKELKELSKNKSEVKKQQYEEQSGRKAGLMTGLYKIGDSKTISLTNTSIPLTDGKGYQLIGAFPYGRNVNPLTGDVFNDLGTFGNQSGINVVTNIQPMMNSEGESAIMKNMFPTKSDIEYSIPRYLDSAIIDTNSLNAETSDIQPSDIMDTKVSSNLIESASKPPDSLYQTISPQVGVSPLLP